MRAIQFFQPITLHYHTSHNTKRNWGTKDKEKKEGLIDDRFVSDKQV